MDTAIYQLGKLTFSLSGEDQVLPYLREELKSIRVTSGKPTLAFMFGNVPTNLQDGIYVSPVICTEQQVIYSGNGYRYSITSENGVLTVNICSHELRGTKKYFSRLDKLKDWNFLLPSEQLAKNFMYNVFDFLTQIENLQAQQSYMHASSFTKGERTVAIVAWGGIGKTTSMLKLVAENNWKFLSDDLGLVDENGNIYRSPKKMQIYAYNLEGQPAFEHMLMEGRSLTDKLNWYYRKATRGVKGVRRRVSGEELFKEKVGTSARLTDVFLIVRAAVDTFESEPVTPEQLALLAASTVMSEIKPFHDIVSAIYSVQKTSVIPRYEEVFDHTKDILTKAFSKTSPVLIRIPLKASPDDLAAYLRRIIE